jgi:hypothetical protein
MMTAEELIDGYGILFDAPLRLAHEAVITYAAAEEPDGWPSIPTLYRFARSYRVDVGQLAALCGVLTYRIGRKLVFCDSRRSPAHVRMTAPAKFGRKVLAAYGFYATAANLIARDRARAH